MRQIMSQEKYHDYKAGDKVIYNDELCIIKDTDEYYLWLVYADYPTIEVAGNPIPYRYVDKIEKKGGD